MAIVRGWHRTGGDGVMQRVDFTRRRTGMAVTGSVNQSNKKNNDGSSGVQGKKLSGIKFQI